MKYKGAGDPMSYDDVLALVKTYITKEESLALIQKAYDFIMVKHKEQKRKSGEPPPRSALPCTFPHVQF